MDFLPLLLTQTYGYGYSSAFYQSPIPMATNIASPDLPSLPQTHSAFDSPGELPRSHRRSLHFPTRTHLCQSLSWDRAVVHRSSQSPWTQTLAARVKAEGVEVALESGSGLSYEKLKELLASGEWRLADEETRRLLIVLAGEDAVKRNYVFFSEVQFIPVEDLKTIDSLWGGYSNGKFGYSVQRRIWKRVNEDFTEFFKKVGWMKAMESNYRQYTYRSFPTEFMWELSSSTPEGHLPLTNALRGKQLLKSVLTHPAFDFADEGVLASSTSDLFGETESEQTVLLFP